MVSFGVNLGDFAASTLTEHFNVGSLMIHLLQIAFLTILLLK